MKKSIVSFIVALCVVVVVYGQVPVVVFGDDHVTELIISTSPDYVPKERFIYDGKFYVDSIYDMDTAYLIYVTKMDSSCFKVFGNILGAGTQFTIIGFKDKDNNKPDGNVIKVGEIYDFTLSPPDGIWTIFPYSDLWKYTENVKSPNGERFQIPYSLINTQIMISKELDGLYYHSTNDNTEDFHQCDSSH